MDSGTWCSLDWSAHDAVSVCVWPFSRFLWLDEINTGDFKTRAVTERPPVFSWWAKLRNGHGRIGWVRMNAQGPTFSQLDACGPPQPVAGAGYL